MNDLQSNLQLLTEQGLVLPSPAYLAGALLFGLIGLVAWRHGRRNERPRATWLGLALMLFPYLTTQTGLLYLLGSILVVMLYINW